VRNYRQVGTLMAALVLTLAMIVSFSGCAASPANSPAPQTSAPAPGPATSAAPTPTTAPAPATSALPPATSAKPPASPSPAPSQAPIKIGALLDFTGFNSVNLEGMKGALELKMDEIGGQWMGRKVQLIEEDAGTDPTTSVDKTRKMVESDKVDVILGPLLSMEAVADYCTKSGTPNILYMHDPASILTKGGGNIFMHFGTLQGLGYYMGDYMATTLGYKTITVIHDDFVAGEDFAGGAIAGFEAKGGTVVQRQRTPPGAVDYSANIAGMKKADAVVFWFTPVSTLNFLQQYYAAGLKMPLVVPNDNVVLTPFMQQIGDQVVGMYGDALWTWMIDTDINKKYMDAFQKKVGKRPETEATSAYIAISIFLEAVKISNGDTSPKAIIDALHKIKLDTPAGTFSYSPAGLGIGNLYIQQIVKENGQYGWKNIQTYSQVPLDVPSSK
jgi:branched-chain amino acid transport system substrate-binding protein